MSKIVAVVPVRAGSKRVQNKGIRPFCDTTLLDYKIAALKRVAGISIVVSSDSEKVIKIAQSHNVTVHKREEYYASSKCTGSEFFVNLAESIDSDIMIYAPPTSPFIKPETIQRAIEYYNSHNCDSVATVHQVKHHMWLDGRPMNYDLSKSPNSQDLPEIMKITYGVCINSNENIIKCKNVVGKNPHLLPVSEIESVDIDTMLDFRFAEFLYEREIENV